MFLLIKIVKKLISVAQTDGLLILSIELILPERLIDHSLGQRVHFAIGDGLLVIIRIIWNMLELMGQYFVR